MFDIREYYAEENRKIQESYRQSVAGIRDIFDEAGEMQGGEKEAFYRFFKSTAGFILKLCDYENVLCRDYFYSKSFEELLAENNELFCELASGNYDSSYANPSYCVKRLGETIGPLLSYFYTLYRQYIRWAFFHQRFRMEEYNRLFIRVYRYIKETADIDIAELKELITSEQIKDKTKAIYYSYDSRMNKDFRYYLDIIEKADLSDPRYLFMYGNYISANEMKTAEFMRQYPDARLKALAGYIAEAYFKSFEFDGKDVKKKSTVGLSCRIGMERLYRWLIEELRARGLESTARRVYSTTVNRQYAFDHRFDIALHLNETYTRMMAASFKKALEKNRDILSTHSGLVVINKFGASPFKPELKKECLKLEPGQQMLLQTYRSENQQIIDSFMPSSETSFCVVAFPTPEIGDKFAEIFDDIVDMNMCDSDKCEQIQQIMIDVLDRAEYVHIKGKGENTTDIRVAMQPLNDPHRQTNFVNVGAAHNIPAGEVFTSPRLKGTNGVLHVEEMFQTSLKFDNLKLTFADGYVSDYSCTNFESEEENRRFIEENLLFPHKTLPIGEFAIGTNTLAYALAKRHDMMGVLPVLIVEKTGPHFAVGDTLFARREDHKIYNRLNKKEVCAVDNEKSILRKTNPRQAYTNKHKDITLPFDAIDFITAVARDGRRVDIIKGGRFVLPGTEELNEPLAGMDGRKHGSSEKEVNT